MTDDPLETLRQDPDVRRNAEAVRELDGLKEQGGWLYLKRTFKNYRDEVALALGKRQMRGEEVDRFQIGVVTGYALAVDDLLGAPEKVVEELEKAAERAYQKLIDQQMESEEAPPYQ